MWSSVTLTELNMSTCVRI